MTKEYNKATCPQSYSSADELWPLKVLKRSVQVVSAWVRWVIVSIRLWVTSLPFPGFLSFPFVNQFRRGSWALTVPVGIKPDPAKLLLGVLTMAPWRHMVYRKRKTSPAYLYWSELGQEKEGKYTNPAYLYYHYYCCYYY